MGLFCILSYNVFSSLFYFTKLKSHSLKVSHLNLRIKKTNSCIHSMPVFIFFSFGHQYILRSVSSLLLIDFNSNYSRNKCSFSFQSDVSINILSTASSLYFCLLQIYCALVCLFSDWRIVCILYVVRSLLWLNFDLESSTILFLFYFYFQVNSYFAVFSNLYLFLMLKSSFGTFFSEFWLIITLISYELFARITVRSLHG